MGEGFGWEMVSLTEEGVCFKEFTGFLVLTIFPIRKFDSDVVILLGGTFKFRIQ